MQHSVISLLAKSSIMQHKKDQRKGRWHKRRRVVVQHQYFLRTDDDVFMFYSQPPNSCLPSSSPNKSVSCSQKHYQYINETTREGEDDPRQEELVTNYRAKKRFWLICIKKYFSRSCSCPSNPQQTWRRWRPTIKKTKPNEAEAKIHFYQCQFAPAGTRWRT